MLKGAACPSVQRQGSCLKMPPGQGRPVNLVESLSWVSQLSAREAHLSEVLGGLREAPITCQAEREPNLVLLSAAEETEGWKRPSHGLRARPTHCTQGCRKSTIKAQAGCIPLSPSVTVNSRRQCQRLHLQVTREAYSFSE